MEVLGASEMVVSGQGLREGIAYGVLRPAPPPIASVREASVRTIASRFATWDQPTAERRAELVATLQRRLDPEATPLEVELLRCAALILDVGRSIDFYRRHEHAAMILRSTDLKGFTHRETVLLSAVVEQADEDDLSLKRYRPLLGSTDASPVDRASAILALADEMERRIPNGDRPRIRCALRNGDAVFSGVEIVSSELRYLQNRFRRAFGRRIRFVTSRTPRARRAGPARS
jgi:exopolyphosphatase/guanosine-5'-triphosphate,3'-diphosphate pyrophosphatase